MSVLFIALVYDKGNFVQLQKIESYDLNRWLNTPIDDIAIFVVAIDTKYSFVLYNCKKIKVSQISNLSLF